MLINLRVKNLALIDEIDVDFTDHLNILTGETGAGKSILIDSINIALGQKVSGDMIRRGEDYAFVELTFHIEDVHTIEELEELGIPVEENAVIVSRRIRSGRSVSKVNDVSVTNATLKIIAGLLIDIHGQHEHQSLLYKSKHLEILDRFGKEHAAGLAENLKETYHSYMDCRRQLDETLIPQEERLRELDFMQYERQEILEARLKKDEEEELMPLFRRMSNASTICDELAKIYALTGGEGSAGEQIGRSVRQFGHLISLDEPLKDFEEQLVGIDALLNDFNREIAGYMSDFEFEPSELVRVEERLDRIHALKAKYGNSYEQIMDYLQKLEEKIKKFEDYDIYIKDLQETKNKLEAELEAYSAKLSKIRKSNAAILEKKIKEALLELNFFEVRFQIGFKKLSSYTAKGYDEVEFLISTNPGEEVKPLGKVASGGELSRIMLAIKSVLADKDEVDTLIFDEIDTGISGRTAQKVSERLALIAKSHQVISITHLPQIASMADEHFIIEKTTDGKTTRTSIKTLDTEASVLELARMLGGAAITEAVIASAREMKELAGTMKTGE